MLKLSSNKGGSVGLRPDDTLTTDEVIILENSATGQGLAAAALDGDAPGQILRADIDTSSTGIITQTKRPKFQGTIEARTTSSTNFIPQIYATKNVGFTHSQAQGRLTVTIAGTYFVMASQLVQTTSVTMYQYLRKNGSTTINLGYSNSDNNLNMRCSGVVEMAVGDYFDIYYQGTLTYSWDGSHSSFVCYLIN